MKPFRSACLALASVCTASVLAHASRPQYGGTLRVQIDAAVRSIDPAAQASDASETAARGRLSSLVFEPLAAIDADGLRPRLAASWEQEGRTGRWRFHVRSGVKLHDGTALEAWQVAASLRASEPAWKIAVQGDTITIDADAPAPNLPWTIADAPHAIVVRGPGGALVGTGPFRLDRVDGTRVSLRAHDAYWRARPLVDAVQIDTGRTFDAQLTDLEAGRADVVAVRAIDARRAARRGVRVEASNPLTLVALIFEPHRVTDATLAWRRTIAAALNRDAMCAAVLQGRGVPARSVLPAWLSGYAPIVAPPDRPVLTRAAVAALPPDMREVTIRIDAGDGVLRAIADRIVVDAREAGFAVTLQTPAGLAPRADARLVRLALTPSSPDRTFVEAAARLAVRGWPAIAPPDGTTLRGTWAAETSLLGQTVIVPIVHLPDLYALAERVGFSAQAAVSATGAWNFADVWVRGKP